MSKFVRLLSFGGLVLCVSASASSVNVDLEAQKREIVRRTEDIEKSLKDTTERINRDYATRQSLPPSQRREIEVLKYQVDEVNAEKCLKRDLRSFVFAETSAADTVERATFQKAFAVMEAKKEAASPIEKETLIAEFRNLSLRISEGLARIISSSACGDQENSYYLALSPTKIMELKRSALIPVDDLKRRIFDSDTGLLYAACYDIKLKIPGHSCD